MNYEKIAMRAKIKKTGEIIDVCCLYPVTYSRLDYNGKIREEFDEDELEFEPGTKMVSLDEICKWIMSNYYLYTGIEYLPVSDSPQAYIDIDKMIKDIRKKFEE